MSFCVTVLVYGETKFCGNGIVLPDKNQAHDYGVDLSSRWTAVKEFRVEESDKSVNYTFLNGELKNV